MSGGAGAWPQGAISGSCTVPAGLTPGINNVYVDEANASPTAGQSVATNTTGYNLGLSNGSLTAVESVTPVSVAAPPTVTAVARTMGLAVVGTRWSSPAPTSPGPRVSTSVRSPPLRSRRIRRRRSQSPRPTRTSLKFSSLTVDVQMTTPAGTSGLNPPSDGYRYEIPVPIPVHPGQPSPCARCPGGLHPSLQLSTSGKRSPCSQGTNDRPAHVGPVVVPGLAQLVGPGAGASEQGAQV